MLNYLKIGQRIKIRHWATRVYSLRGHSPLCPLNQDESPLTRKENYRLRTERNIFRNLEENKEKKIIIYRGKLTVVGNVYDEFNIEN